MPPDDTRRAHEAVLGVDQVHRPAEPPAEPGVAAHQLGHRALERGALRDRVPVRAVPRVDGVVVAQLGAHGRGDPLLAHAEVDQAVHLVGLLEPADAFLEQRGSATSSRAGPVPPRGRAAGRSLRRHGRRPEHLPHRGHDLGLVRHDEGLERLAVGHGRVERRDQPDRRLERREAVLGDLRGDHARGRRMPRPLVDQHEPAGLLDRLQDRLGVERRQRARIDDLGLDALLGELLGRVERAVDAPAGGDDRDVAALAPDGGLAERHEVLAVGHLAVLEREQVVVQVDDRVVVADRGRHQALGVGRRRRHDDLAGPARP